MATIQQVRDNFRDISSKVRSRLPEMVSDTAFEITELNKDQLQEGIDSQGKTLSPEYKNPYYSKKKFSMNSRAGFGIPDLKFKGGFYRGFDVVVGYDSFEVNSSNSKTEELVKKYGKYIFGLTKQNKYLYGKDVLQEELRGYIYFLTGV